MAIKATKMSVNLPFGLGGLDFEANEVEQRAAWSLYVELMTRIATEPLDHDEGILREALASLYSLFGLTRQILREAGPEVAHGPESFGPVAISVLNKGIRPFTAKWHRELKKHEDVKPEAVSQVEHEHNWQYFEQMHLELKNLQEEMKLYARALAQISGAE